MSHDKTADAAPVLGRRRLIKMGAGVVMLTLNAPRAAARGRCLLPGQQFTGAGYINDAKRLSGNAPMGDTDSPDREVCERVLRIDPCRT